MSIIDDVSLMRRIPLFAQIDSAQLKLLVFTSERLSYRAGQSIFHQGDDADSAYVIVDGEADILIDTPDGQIAVAHLGKNALVGEIGLLCDVPRTAGVRATTDLAALKISKEHFLKLLKEFPDAATSVMRELAQRLATTTRELTEARSQLRGQQATAG